MNLIRMRLSSRYFFIKSPFFRHVAILTGGTVIAQIINLIASPIIARIYRPEDLGNFSTYVSMVSILAVIACLRYETAIPLSKNDETAISLLILSFMIVFVMAGILGVILFIFSDQIVLLLNTPLLKPYLWLLPVSFMVMGIYQALSFWAIRMNEYGQIAKTKFYQSFGIAITQVSLGLIALKPAGLLIGDAVGRTCGVATLAILTWKQWKEIIRNISKNRIIKAAKEYRRFPFISTGANLLNSLNLYLPSLITTAIYGTGVSGQLMLSQIVLGIPSILFAGAISQAYFGESAKIAKNSPHEQMPLFRKTLFRLTIIGVLVYGFISITAPFIINLVFGEKWNDASLYIQISTPMFLFQFIGSPLSAIQDVLQRLDLQMMAQVSRMALLFGASFTSFYFSLEPVYWLILLSISMAVAYIFSIYISWITINSTSRMDS